MAHAFHLLTLIWIKLFIISMYPPVARAPDSLNLMSRIIIPKRAEVSLCACVARGVVWSSAPLLDRHKQGETHITARGSFIFFSKARQKNRVLKRAPGNDRRATKQQEMARVIVRTGSLRRVTCTFFILVAATFQLHLYAMLMAFVTSRYIIYSRRVM